MQSRLVINKREQNVQLCYRATQLSLIKEFPLTFSFCTHPVIHMVHYSKKGPYFLQHNKNYIAGFFLSNTNLKKAGNGATSESKYVYMW